MTDLEAIDLRHSRRSYLGTPIAREKISILRTAINEYNKTSGLSIQFIENGKDSFSGFTASYGFFSGVTSYIAIVGKNGDIHQREKAGYYGEKLVLQAVSLGLGTCWVGGTFNKKRILCTIREDEGLLILILVGNVDEKKGFKENAIYKLAHHGTKPVDKLYSSDTEAPVWFLEGMEAVRKAPSAINRQPVLFHYTDGIVTAEVKHIDNHETIDLGIAKLHFEIGVGRGRFELGNRGKFVP